MMHERTTSDAGARVQLIAVRDAGEALLQTGRRARRPPTTT
jgi:hypothetical protein